MLARAGQTRLASRCGSVSAYVLVLLPLLLLAGSLAINAAWMADARTAMQGSTDAAALAAAQAFVDDDFLRGDRQTFQRLVDEARTEAQHFARCNPVLGRPVDLRRNEDNDVDGDIVIGRLDRKHGQFVPVDCRDEKHESGQAIDAVRIRLRCTKERGHPIELLGCLPGGSRCRDAETRATAVLDGHVLGFRPVFTTPIPLVPIALFSSPNGKHEHSWEHQACDGGGRDEWSFHCQSKTFVRGPDGLHEMHVEFGRCDRDDDDKRGKNDDENDSAKQENDGNKDGNDDDKDRDRDGRDDGGSKRRGNAFLCQIGSDSPETFRRQIAEGLRCEHLREFGGEFVLGRDNSISVRGRGCAPEHGSPLQHALLAGLYQLWRSGEPRVWPLFSEMNGKDKVIITGFVAARVVKLEAGDDDAGVRFVLQPTRMSTATAVTEFDRRRSETWIDANPYVVKVRLVE